MKKNILFALFIALFTFTTFVAAKADSSKEFAEESEKFFENNISAAEFSKYCDEVIKKEKNKSVLASAYAVKAFLALVEKNQQEYEKYIKIATDMEPDNPYAALFKAAVLLAQGKKKEARSVLEAGYKKASHPYLKENFEQALKDTE